MNYIPKQSHSHFQSFRYKGGTQSITYQYLWSPFAEYLLKFVPKSIAPNLITLFTLAFLLVAHVLFMLPQEGEIAQWKYFMMATSIILYQHFDNIDGKQARRTNSSTPLGMLFDHGSDSISAFLISLQVLKIFKVSPTLSILTVFAMTMSIYLIAMWSQFAIGYFRLGRINPVDEGLPAYALLALIAAFIDTSYLQDYHWVGTYGEEFIMALIPIAITQIFDLGKKILREKKFQKKDQSFVGLYVLTGISLLCFYLKDNEFYDKYFYEIYYCLMLMWTRNMILIQLHFVNKTRFRCLNVATNLFLAFALGYLFFADFVGCQLYFLTLTILEGMLLVEFVVAVMREGAAILSVHIFTIKQKK